VQADVHQSTDLVRLQFDIVKVRLQSSNAYSGMGDCATRIAKEEGMSAFYKGTLMPFCCVGACVALQFAFLQSGKRYFECVAVSTFRRATFR
jgi:solute carrier family 25 (mitochondrial carnitine/acylcarnitine transporter), member 20/29